MVFDTATRVLLSIGLGAATIAAVSSAQAALCSELNLPNPIYGAGGSAITAELAKVAEELAKFEPPITILWADPGACTGYQYFVSGDFGGTGTRPLKYWSATGQALTCDLPIGEVVAPQFAHMGNTAEFCAGQSLPADVRDFAGPIQTVNLITDKDSSQKSISAEALYYIWGLGPSASGVSPWTDETALWGRNTSSFVHLFLAAAVGVPSNGFKLLSDHVVSNQSQVISGIVASGNTNADASLGYVSSSAADAARASVKTLAYQHTGQLCGYWPDSSEDALDKINVRTGKYHLWTPGHFFAKVDQRGAIVEPNVRKLIACFTDQEVSPGDVITRRIIEAGDVPQCAMRVKREGVLGALSSFAPPAPCGCYFEAVATQAVPSSCTACEDDNGCDGETPKCHHGFCEAY
ncbi:MAG TPA: hypothetical protein VFQ61_26920 [Polyangiaceae bacterium]|nr:hypothetical protein [Polyangiaceae bacterium]